MVFDKQEYWKNRAEKKRGQGIVPNLTKVFKTPENIVIGFDALGRMVAKTRAYRRKKTPTDPKHTKATHKMKKAKR